MNLDNDALEFMTHTLEKFAGVGLTDEQRTAAATLLSVLPHDTLIKDFMLAASPDAVAQRGLPASIADALHPLISNLELSLCYAGKFAALFESARPATPA